MAYQRLQVTRALKVHKTTTSIDIPDPDFAGITGTNATSATKKLTVAAADTFTAKTVQPGYIVENVTTGAYALVSAIDSFFVAEVALVPVIPAKSGSGISIDVVVL